MNKQPTRRRRASRAAARTLTVGAAVAALVGILGAGQALAQPDERVLERQGRIDYQAAAGQADQQGNAEEPSQGSPTENVRRFIRPEPNMGPPPQLDGDEPLFPAPAPRAPASDRTGLVISLAVAALLLALGAAIIWRVRRRRPPPEPTQPDSTQPELTHTDSIA
jgi:hypothetical protein